MFFFFNDTATTEIYTLSLHDALPISAAATWTRRWSTRARRWTWRRITPATTTPSGRCTSSAATRRRLWRSEEHTSELQSRQYLVCRLLLEKKKSNLLLSQTNILTFTN